jgi:hypothetical protein
MVLASRAHFLISPPKQNHLLLILALNMNDIDTPMSPPPSLEPVTYVWVEPGVSTLIEGFAYVEVLTVALDGEDDVLLDLF